MKKSKMVLKITIVILCILLVIFLINTVRKVFILQNIGDKVTELSKKENYYWNMKLDNNEIVVYKKEEKAIMIMQAENGKITFFKNGDILNTYDESQDEKMATLNEKKEFDNINLPCVINQENIKPVMLTAMNSKIKSTTIDEKECYLIESSSENFITHTSVEKVQIFIEKETGLAIKVIEYNNEETTTIDYKYEFDKVTDEDLKEPNINEYKIKE